MALSLAVRPSSSSMAVLRGTTSNQLSFAGEGTPLYAALKIRSRVNQRVSTFRHELTFKRAERPKKTVAMGVTGRHPIESYGLSLVATLDEEGPR